MNIYTINNIGTMNHMEVMAFHPYRSGLWVYNYNSFAGGMITTHELIVRLGITGILLRTAEN